MGAPCQPSEVKVGRLDATPVLRSSSNLMVRHENFEEMNPRA